MKKKKKINPHKINSVNNWYDVVRPTEYCRPYSLKFSSVMSALKKFDGEMLEELLCGDTMVREEILEESLVRILHDMKAKGKTEKAITRFCEKLQNLSAYAYTPYGIECAMKKLAEWEKEEQENAAD